MSHLTFKVRYDLDGPVSLQQTIWLEQRLNDVLQDWRKEGDFTPDDDGFPLVEKITVSL